MWNQFRCAKRAADPAKTGNLLLTHDLFVTVIVKLILFIIKDLIE